jgi:FG-GAP-like repeat/Immunoglobulin domain
MHCGSTDGDDTMKGMSAVLPALACLWVGVAADAGLGQCPLSFGPSTTLPTASNYAQGVALGDFDNDGATDMAVCILAANVVSVYLGNNDGTFRAPVNYPTGNQPYWVLAADVSGDGRLDLVISNSNGASSADSTVSVLKGNGNGTFRAATNFAVRVSPRSMGLGDFNGDGLPDIAVADNETGGIAYLTILMNDPAAPGSFRPAVNYNAGTGAANSLAVADFNGDGRPDAAFANRVTNNVKIFVCNPDGTFTAGLTWATGTRPVSIVAGDFDGDSHADFATANEGANSVTVWYGTGNGFFVNTRDLPVGSSPEVIVARDVDGDSWPDLAAMNIAGTVSILLGAPYQTFHPATNYGGGSFGAGLAVGDINADGRLDLVVTNGNADTVSVRLGAVPLAVAITQQPTPVVAPAGQSASFSVGASGSPRLYQWRKNGVNLADGGPVSGATAATLSINPVAQSDDGAAFDCVVSNGCGSVRSNPAGLGVSGGCGSADFNGDGDIGTDADIEAFFRVLAGGSC